MREVQPGSGRAAERARRPGSLELEGRPGQHHPGLQRGLPPVHRSGLAGAAAPGRFRRPGPAQDRGRCVQRDAQLSQPELRAVPAADRRRHRGAADRRLGRAEGDLPGQAGERRMDRHHEPDRAAGRQRPGAGAQPRRAAGRRHLQGLRHQDLHHLRRARHGGQHRPPGARARGRCARGRQGHQPVRGAQVPGQSRRLAGRAQRRALRQHRAQAGHQGLAHGGAAVRRQRGGPSATSWARRTAASSTCSS